MLPPRLIYWRIIACIWAEYLFRLYLYIRQRRVYFATKEKIPSALKKHLTLDTFEKSRLFAIDSINFQMMYSFYFMVILTALLHYEGLYKGWVLTEKMHSRFKYWPTWLDEKDRRSIIFILLAIGFICIVILPISLYRSWVIHYRLYFIIHRRRPDSDGFKYMQTLAGWYFKYFFKKFANGAIWRCPTAGPIVWMSRGEGQPFLSWLCGYIFRYIIYYCVRTYRFLNPLGNSYAPLKEGPLRNRIEALAARMNFPMKNLFVLKSSKTSMPIAYTYGIWKLKVIVLYDTLIKDYYSEGKEKGKNKQAALERKKKTGKPEEVKEEKRGCDDEQVEAIVGHELGHCYLNHGAKKIVIDVAYSLLSHTILELYCQQSVLYEAFGFPKKSEKPYIIGIIIVQLFVLQFLNTAMNYLMKAISRRHEYQADAVATNLGYGSQLKEALIKSTKDNWTFPILDPLYAAWHRTHPTLFQRLRAIDRLEKAKIA